jgi:hypothetical protein
LRTDDPISTPDDDYRISGGVLRSAIRNHHRVGAVCQRPQTRSTHCVVVRFNFGLRATARHDVSRPCSGATHQGVQAHNLASEDVQWIVAVACTGFRRQ